jgi:putative oxidoreductase
MSTLIDWLEAGRRLAERIPYSLVALVARVAVASLFWRSGQTKVEGLLHIKDNTFFLFREEYKVTLLPPGPCRLSFDHRRACLSGPADRWACLTALRSRPHGDDAGDPVFRLPRRLARAHSWFALLLLIIARGPGAVSLDHLIRTRMQPEPVPAR